MEFLKPEKKELLELEDMNSRRWKNFVEKEQKNWQVVIEDPVIQANVSKIESEIKENSEYSFGTDQINICKTGTFSLKWIQYPSSLARDAVDLHFHGTKSHIWAIEESADSNGSEKYDIVCYSREGEVQWSFSGVGPFVSIVGGRCYVLEAKNSLIYYRLVSFNAYTGKDKEIHYEEKDSRYNLELIRVSFEKNSATEIAYMKRQAGGKQDLFSITKNCIKCIEGISLNSRRFICGSNEYDYLMWESGSGNGWNISESLARFIFPSFANDHPESIESVKGYLITKSYGYRKLWKLSKTKKPVVLWGGFATIQIDPWNPERIHFTELTSKKGSFIWDINSNTLPKSPNKQIYTVKRVFTSGGNADSPYIIVKGLSSSSSSNSAGLLVIGYGAYGLPTSFSLSRWIPFLNRGWSIAIGLWMGGGDHSPSWEDKGRLGGRIDVLEAAADVVKDAKRVCGVDASHTIVYGRSAGGLWVGGLCAKYPDGSFFGHAYMEVPYLDVLRTTMNRALPLTNIEADEFGLPGARIMDLRHILNWSPMDLLTSKGTPGINQLLRTGLNDKEVFPYESAKWVLRSRGTDNKNILLAIQGEQGHFVSGKTNREQKALDIAVLLQKISKSR